MFNGLQLITIWMGYLPLLCNLYVAYVIRYIVIMQISLPRVKTRRYLVSLPLVCLWSFVISFEYWISNKYFSALAGWFTSSLAIIEAIYFELETASINSINPWNTYDLRYHNFTVELKGKFYRLWWQLNSYLKINN